VIRICIADDQALVRSGISALLALFDGLSVVAEAQDGEAAVQAVLAEKPDVLLLDMRMPRLNGVQVISTLAAQEALPATLLLTTFEDDTALVAGVRACARGYLLKGVTPEVLVDAIRAVAAGGSYLYAPLAAALNMRNQPAQWHKEAIGAPHDLTDRETDVLKLMTSGISNREIAKALKIGEGTVRNHASNIFLKLGVTDRTKAVLYALRERLV
jgi:DNA-binding NarL/FixJ family response regulator